MKILAIEKDLPETPGKSMQPFLAEEARKAWSLVQGGVIREISFTRKDRRAVLVLECRDEAEAEQMLAQLPLVREGLIAFDVFGLQPYDGFERLFEKPAPPR
jgi:hypothetical protein